MAVIFVIIVWLNWYSPTMLVVYGYYIDFKNIILSGFDISQSKLCTPTFPMWGYGWLLLLTENKFLLLSFQSILALISVWYFFKLVNSNELLDKKTILIFKLLLVFALPFYAFHSIRWPYSYSVSLVILSLLFFVEGFFLNKNNLKKIVLSALFFGLALNFRSDYYLVPVGFAIMALIFQGFSLLQLKKVIIWLAFTYMLLIPWGIYAYHVTGHFLLTSTNQGHVMFIGLGNLPENKWGITKLDQDSVLKEVMFNKYKEHKSTLLYETNKFVLSEFKKRVKNNPAEYMRKNIYATKELLLKGVYPGDFLHHEILKIQPIDTCWTQPGESWKWEKSYNEYKGIGKIIVKNPLNIFDHIGFIPLLRIIAKKISAFYGRIIVFFALIFLPLTIYFSIREKNYLIFFSLLLILYQVSVNILAYNWNLYTSNVFFFLLLTLSYSLRKISLFISKRCNLIKGNV